MKCLRLLILILIVWPWTLAQADPPGRTWTTLVDFSSEYKHRPITDTGDPPCTQNFTVPGPGLLRWTFYQEPFHSTQVRIPDTGVFGLSPSDSGAQLGYPAFYRHQKPELERDGVAMMWCSIGEILKAQPAAWTRFIPAVNYPCTWQLGCKIRMVIEFSPGLRQPGEQFGPPESLPGKASYYEAGVIDSQGRRSGPVGPQWVIYTDGRIEAPGVWRGRYSKQGDGSLTVKMALNANGAQDEFILKQSNDGFVAFKDGKPYRWGRLVRKE